MSPRRQCLRVRFIAAFFAGAFWASFIQASSDGIGSTTANFLKLGVGARGEAMGEAFSALADDANAIYWNPAGLSQIPEKMTSVTFMHAPYLSPTYYDFLGYAHNTGDWGVLGGALQYFSGGSITQTDVTGTNVGSFSPYDMALSFSYANTWNGFGFGINGKWVHSKLLDSAQTVATDLGVLSPTYFERVRFAFVAANLGGKMTFDQEAEPLPRDVKFGSAFQLTPDWTATFDINVPNDNNPYPALGSEYRWPLKTGGALAARLGYNARASGDIDGVSGVTAGAGLRFSRYSIDYAMVPMGALGLTQRLSLSVSFGTPPNLLEKVEAYGGTLTTDQLLDLLTEQKTKSAPPPP